MRDNSIKWWKFAFSVSIVAALAAPIFTGAFRLSRDEWAFLTAPQNEISSLNSPDTDPDPCNKHQGFAEKLCEESSWDIVRHSSKLQEYISAHPVLPAENIPVSSGSIALHVLGLFLVSAAAFVFIFITLIVLPRVSRSYLTWLRK